MFARAAHFEPRPSLYPAGDPLVSHPAGGVSPAEQDQAARLTGALVRGDSAALDQLYREHLGPMVGLARRSSGRDEAFAFDAVHDAFVRIISAPRVCATEDLLRAWLRRAVISAVIDRLRAEARRRRREHAFSPGEAATSEPDAADQLAWLARELGQLAQSDRDLLSLRYRAELTLAEIAEINGTTQGSRNTLGFGAIQGRIRRVILRLRRSAQEYFE